MFFRRHRRKKLLATPLDQARRAVLHTVAPLCASLPPELRDRHEGIVQLLLQEKTFEGAGGLELTDSMRLAIAGQAALLQLRRDADVYPGLETILLYPEAFVVPHEEYDEEGLVHADPEARAGESWQRGAVVLSWEDVDLESSGQNGYNVVLHEFAHQLDDQSGEGDGTPLLHSSDQTGRWVDGFQAAFEKHGRALALRREVLFDANAAESPSEFFATAMELFFEYPGDLKMAFPTIYELLEEYLELDPARWTGN